MRQYQYRELPQLLFELNNNKAILLPTDTVMGIVTKNPKLLYLIKNRPHHKKLILFISDSKQIKNLTLVEKNILDKYWPGQLTIIKNTTSYRIPAQLSLLKLLKKSGPLYSSSANISGYKPVIDSQQGIKTFHKWTYEMVVVTGKQNTTTPSTIINFDKKQVVRVGAIDPKPIIQALQNTTAHGRK
jgi:L-threonylcarbamoyladenylate synthase